jgi:hypothetical protein
LGAPLDPDYVPALIIDHMFQLKRRVELLPTSFGRCQYFLGPTPPEPVTALLLCSPRTCPANVHRAPATRHHPRVGFGGETCTAPGRATPSAKRDGVGAWAEQLRWRGFSKMSWTGAEVGRSRECTSDPRPEMSNVRLEPSEVRFMFSSRASTSYSSGCPRYETQQTLWVDAKAFGGHPISHLFRPVVNSSQHCVDGKLRSTPWLGMFRVFKFELGRISFVRRAQLCSWFS